MEYFEKFDGAQYLPRPWLKAIYPKDSWGCIVFPWQLFGHAQIQRHKSEIISQYGGGCTVNEMLRLNRDLSSSLSIVELGYIKHGLERNVRM